ncbi:hypothetical protein IV203_018067 [Nitzschia inconspicua]|uniref:Methyltransferase domain-containing protein n=1 Tax=Nitzschia inconspicua TaxID=303405 RepID=A0A9K3M1Z9_9STRA|nr:hypothetical protein IV203_018067 [Nitzschia inconspicua]
MRSPYYGPASSSRRRRRRTRLTDLSSSSDERILELTPSSSLAAVFVLLAVGATLATVHIMMVNSSEGCFLGEYRAALSDNDHPQFKLAQKHPTTNVSKRSIVSAQRSTTPIVTTVDNFPSICTAAQMESIKKQLKPEGCFGGRPWTQPCSFTQATIGCQDHFWMTEVYAHQSFPDTPFVAIIIGWPKGLEKTDFFMVDLQLGTKNPTTYDANKILAKYGNTCPSRTLQYSGMAAPTTKVYVLESDPNKIINLQAIQQELHAENHLIIETKDFTKSKGSSGSLDAWVQDRLPANEDAIHHLSINVEGWDFEILMGASNMLNRVRYVDFEVQWKLEWNKGSLSILIRKLKTRGFVCYFSGSNGNLWRITDCWLNHYGEKHWGRVACVNAHHPDVNEILERMEIGFTDTISRAISFGY